MAHRERALVPRYENLDPTWRSPDLLRELVVALAYLINAATLHDAKGEELLAAVIDRVLAYRRARIEEDWHRYAAVLVRAIAPLYKKMRKDRAYTQKHLVEDARRVFEVRGLEFTADVSKTVVISSDAIRQKGGPQAAARKVIGGIVGRYTKRQVDAWMKLPGKAAPAERNTQRDRILVGVVEHLGIPQGRPPPRDRTACAACEVAFSPSDSHVECYSCRLGVHTSCTRSEVRAVPICTDCDDVDE